MSELDESNESHSVTVKILRDRLATIERKLMERESVYRDDLLLITNAAKAWSELITGQEIYTGLAKALHQIVGEQVIVSVGEFDESGHRFANAIILGLEPLLDRMTALLGKKPIELSGGFPSTVKAAVVSGQLTRVPGGLGELLSDVLSRFVIRQLEQLLRLGEVHVIGFGGGRCAGAVFLATRAPGVELRQHTIEALVRTAAHAIERALAVDNVGTSRAQLRAVVDVTPFPIAVMDAENDQIHFWSRTALSLFGYAPVSVTNWQKAAFPDPTDRTKAVARWERHLAQARQSARAIDAGEYRVGCSDSSTRDCQLYVARVADCIVVTFNDVTERMRAESALRESEDKFRHLFEYSVVGTSITLPTGAIMVNRAFCEMLGYAPGELDRAQWQQLTHPDDVARSEREIAAIRSGSNSSVRFEKRYLTKSGAVVWVELGSTPRRDEAGNLLYLFTSVVDITNRKRAEAALLASERNLKEAQRLARIGSWEWDLVTDEMSWSEELFQIKQRNPSNGSLTLTSQDQPYTTDSLVRLKAAVQQARSTGKPFELELESSLANGSSMTTLVIGEAQQDAKGKVVLLRGIEQDITERKRSEQARTETLVELRRWHEVTLGRETRILELKTEVNALLGKIGEAARYPSAEPEGSQ